MSSGARAEQSDQPRRERSEPARDLGQDARFIAREVPIPMLSCHTRELEAASNRRQAVAVPVPRCSVSAYGWSTHVRRNRKPSCPRMRRSPWRLSAPCCRRAGLNSAHHAVQNTPRRRSSGANAAVLDPLEPIAGRRTRSLLGRLRVRAHDPAGDRLVRHVIDDGARIGQQLGRDGLAQMREDLGDNLVLGDEPSRTPSTTWPGGAATQAARRTRWARRRRTGGVCTT
jgi:hypothetical protein